MINFWLNMLLFETQLYYTSPYYFIYHHDKNAGTAACILSFKHGRGAK